MKTLYIIIISSLLFASCQREEIPVTVYISATQTNGVTLNDKCKFYKSRFGKSEEYLFNKDNQVYTFKMVVKKGEKYFYKLESESSNIKVGISVISEDEGKTEFNKQSVTLTGRY